MLYVDDFRRGVSQGFTDAQQDQRNRDMLRAAGIPVDDPNQFGQINTFGPTDQQGDPTLLRLADPAADERGRRHVLVERKARDPEGIAAAETARYEARQTDDLAREESGHQPQERRRSAS